MMRRRSVAMRCVGAAVSARRRDLRSSADSACARWRLWFIASLPRDAAPVVAVSELSSSRTNQEQCMDWNEIESKWLQYAARVQQRWSALDTDDIAAIAGRRQQLADRLQERYGITASQAEQQIDDFCVRMDAATTRDKSAREAA
jgi:uncharacterized protein YjbJ (UPF0337 family)